jgi:MoxR-like ATPase
MEEQKVSMDGETHAMTFPFFVIATQNPIEQEGTYPLPEAQVDRFMLKVVVDYPSKSEEQLIIRQNTLGLNFPPINPVASTSEILTAKELVRQVYMDEKVENYILDIVFATRFPDKYGLPKVTPLIRSICKDVLRHRIGLTYEAEAENVNVEQIINEILRVVNVP